MGKVIFWLVIVFVVLFGLRLLNASKLRDRSKGAKGSADMAMIKCVECGVFLPRTDATTSPDGYRCGDPACPNRKRTAV